MGILDTIVAIKDGICSIGKVLVSHKKINENSIMQWIDEMHKIECRRQGVQVEYEFKLGNPETDAAIVDKTGIIEELIGKTGSKALGGCLFYPDGSIKIEYYPNRYMDNLKNVFMCNKLDALSLIETNVAHEIYHVRQFRWLYQRGGYEAVSKALEEEHKYNYSEGPIERGACNYSLGGIEQDFDFELGCYV